ncbi:Uncharacterised protein [uncultured archaeon]|nr:Uncharacterised protein [uncultured archaeon]
MAKKKEKTTKERKNKKNSKKEEVCEIFDVEKNGKETEIKSCGMEEEKIESPGQVDKEKKIFLKLAIIMIGLFLFFVAFYLMSYYSMHFDYKGVKFEVTKMGQLTLYKTSLPVTTSDGKRADYNFYLRNDPRKLEAIQFDGQINLSPNMVLNMTNNFNCNGDGMIAIANIQNLYNLIGTKMIKDENATCDLEGRYMFLRIRDGNKTGIMEYGIKGGCYNIDINNCEILPATEKFMLETLITVNAKLKSP